VIDILEVGYVKDLPMLVDLNLQDNPVCRVPDYRLHALFIASQICTLDQLPASLEEKVCTDSLHVDLVIVSWYSIF